MHVNGVPALKYIGLLELPIVDVPSFVAVVAVTEFPVHELAVVADATLLVSNAMVLAPGEAAVPDTAPSEEAIGSVPVSYGWIFRGAVFSKASSVFKSANDRFSSMPSILGLIPSNDII